MFPTTDNSQTIIDALMGAAFKAGVQIRTNVRVESVGKGEDGRFQVSTKERLQEGGGDGGVRCDYVLLAPGSSRLAYKWAIQLGEVCTRMAQPTTHTSFPRRPASPSGSAGHVLEDPVPSLFTFNIEDGLLMGLAGLSVQDAEVSVVDPKKPK